MGKRGGTLLVAGGLAFLLGAAVCIGGVVLLVQSLIGALAFEPRPVPGTFTEQLDADTPYTISLAASPINDAPVANLQSVVITGPDGTPVPTESIGFTQTIGSGGDTFVSVIGFDSTVAGAYDFDVTTTGPTRARIVPRFTAGGIGLTAVLIGVGGLVATLGVVMLIIGGIMRSRSGKGSTGPPSQPGPSGPGQPAPGVIAPGAPHYGPGPQVTPPAAGYPAPPAQPRWSPPSSPYQG
ncbi:MAG: hypothetical protein AAGD35_07065 [Actinomycetota bacterium]